MRQNQKDLDDFRVNWKSRKLQYSKRPKHDIINGERKPIKDLLNNIDKRLLDLAELLVSLFKIYKRDKELYGDAFLAFVGNNVIRGYPWKDFPLTSKKAEEIIGSGTTGLSDYEITANKKNIHYEHCTPISFFRDLFDNYDELDRDDFYYILKKYYKVARLEKGESSELNCCFKTTRPVDVYEKLEIEIIEKEHWF